MCHWETHVQSMHAVLSPTPNSKNTAEDDTEPQFSQSLLRVGRLPFTPWWPQHKLALPTSPLIQ